MILGLVVCKMVRQHVKCGRSVGVGLLLLEGLELGKKVKVLEVPAAVAVAVARLAAVSVFGEWHSSSVKTRRKES